ncbi:Tetratricopeptide repeat protein [compost metagenome]
MRLLDAKLYPFENAILLQSSALNDVAAGNYADGLTNSLQASTVFKQLGNTLFRSRALQLLGVICYRTRNFEMSEKFSRESLSKITPKFEYYKSLINMYSVQAFIKGKSQSAQHSLLQIIPVLEKSDDQGLLAVVYLNAGVTHYFKNEPDKAQVYFEKALDINRQIDNKSFTVSLYVNLSAYLIERKEYTAAKRYLKESEMIAGNSEQLSMVYLAISNLYDGQGDTANAYLYLKKHNTVKDAILNSSKTIDSYQDYVSNFLKSAENEVNLTKNEALLEKRKYMIGLLFAIFIILLSVSLLVILQQKRRQQTIIRKAEKQSLEKELFHEKEIQLIHEQKHKEVLDAKAREVTSYSLMLSSKNNVLQEVLHQTRLLKKVLKPEDADLYRSVVDVINDNLNKDLESNKFMYHFNEVNPDFFNKLKEACSDLTENNLRMCAYFKMGMTAKQVASILNISVETVKNGRYRLKKKLGLTEQDNLDDFIRNI